MKLTATVVGARPKGGHVYRADRETEPYTVADVQVDGDAALIAASLRALVTPLTRPTRWRRCPPSTPPNDFRVPARPPMWHGFLGDSAAGGLGGNARGRAA